MVETRFLVGVVIFLACWVSLPQPNLHSNQKPKTKNQKPKTNNKQPTTNNQQPTTNEFRNQID